MSKSLTDLIAEKRDRILNDAETVIAQAEAEGRDLTDDEAAIVSEAAEARKQLEAKVTALRPQNLEENVNRLDAQRARLAQRCAPLAGGCQHHMACVLVLS